MALHPSHYTLMKLSPQTLTSMTSIITTTTAKHSNIPRVSNWTSLIQLDFAETEMPTLIIILMSQHTTTDNILLTNRRALTSRQSMDSLISYARQQDEKIYTRGKRFHYGKFLTLFAIFLPPLAYMAYSITVGNWRKIYHTSVISTPIEAVSGNIREYFVPEMYLKEREIRKIELGLKDTEELRAIYNKPKAQ